MKGGRKGNEINVTQSLDGQTMLCGNYSGINFPEFKHDATLPLFSDEATQCSNLNLVLSKMLACVHK